MAAQEAVAASDDIVPPVTHEKVLLASPLIINCLHVPGGVAVMEWDGVGGVEGEGLWDTMCASNTGTRKQLEPGATLSAVHSVVVHATFATGAVHARNHPLSTPVMGFTKLQP